MSSSYQPENGDGMRILIVDADHRNRSLRARSLGLLGYRIDEAASEQQVRAKLELERYDLMLLALDASAEQGTEPMSLAGEIQPGMLLIVLAQEPTLDSAIKAIRAGAVDYLIEPVEIQDLFRSVAQALQKQAAERGRMLNYVSQLLDEVGKSGRVDVSSKVSHIGADPAVKIAGNLKLDLTDRRLTIIGDPTYAIRLTKNGTALLAGLMSRPNRVLSCRQIAKIAWGYDLPEDEAAGVVQSTIYRLRRRIGANPRSPEIIRTIRGRGYMFTPD